jgi:hypothetical protein
VPGGTLCQPLEKLMMSRRSNAGELQEHEHEAEQRGEAQVREHGQPLIEPGTDPQATGRQRARLRGAGQRRPGGVFSSRVPSLSSARSRR